MEIAFTLQSPPSVNPEWSVLRQDHISVLGWHPLGVVLCCVNGSGSTQGHSRQNLHH